jgi:Helix-turn-helix domain
MDPDTPAPPPEALLIRIARKAAGLTAEAAAKSTGGMVSPVYWRDVERGYGYRRGERVPARASDRVLAHMAYAVRVAPGRLVKSGRADAAAVLDEILQAGAPAGGPGAPLEMVLAGLASRRNGNEVVQAMAAARSKDAGTRIMAILRFLKDPDADREVLDHLLSLRLDGDEAEVVQALGRQRGRREQVRVAEILEFLGWRPPEMEVGNGTAG